MLDSLGFGSLGIFFMRLNSVSSHLGVALKFARQAARSCAGLRSLASILPPQLSPFKISVDAWAKLFLPSTLGLFGPEEVAVLPLARQRQNVGGHITLEKGPLTRSPSMFRCCTKFLWESTLLALAIRAEANILRKGVAACCWRVTGRCRAFFMSRRWRRWDRSIREGMVWT